MKKNLLYTTLFLSLIGCAGQLKNTKDRIIRETAKATISEICMAKYNNETQCKCVTNKVVDSLDTKDLKHLAKIAIKGNSMDSLAKDSVIGKKILSAQIDCTIDKGISSVKTLIKKKLSK